MSSSFQLRRLVAGARAQLAELETDFTKEKSRVDAVQAVLFRHLRSHHHKRDRLRLAVEYRQKFLDSFIRDDTDEVEQAEKDFEQAKVRLDEDYEELASAADKKKLVAGQQVEVTHPWDKLDFKDAEEPGQLQRLHETLQSEIAAVAESLKELRASPDYELCQLAEKRPGVLDELAAERAQQLEVENAELEKQAEELAAEIKKLSDVD